MYTYAGFWTQNVKNIKHWQLPVPQKLDSSRTVHANLYNIYIDRKLQTRRIYLRCWNRGFWQVQDIIVSWSGFSYCFHYFPIIQFISFAPCLGLVLFLLHGGSHGYYWVLVNYSYIQLPLPLEETSLLPVKIGSGSCWDGPRCLRWVCWQGSHGQW